jgi:cytochrome c
MFKSTISLAGATAVLALAFLNPAQAAPDEEAAKALMKANDCTKCHAVDKTKKGPAFKKIAEKYKGKADGQSKIVTSLTTGPTVKIDGNEEKHKIVDTKDQKELKNLADWILAQ